MGDRADGALIRKGSRSHGPSHSPPYLVCMSKTTYHVVQPPYLSSLLLQVPSCFFPQRVLFLSHPSSRYQWCLAWNDLQRPKEKEPGGQPSATETHSKAIGSAPRRVSPRPFATWLFSSSEETMTSQKSSAGLETVAKGVNGDRPCRASP